MIEEKNMCSVDESNDSKDLLKIRIIFNKKTYELSLESDKTLSHLKREVQALTCVAPDMQKLILKGKTITENDKTLVECGIKNNDKILLVGSTLYDVSAAITPCPQSEDQKPNTSQSNRICFCKQYKHKKIIDKGVPEQAMPAYRNGDEPLPEEGVRGMVNKYGKNCRITFKLETDELWVCTEHKTNKYSISNIILFEDQTIEGHDNYSIVLIQMRDKLCLWFYWVPNQYIKAMRKSIH